jgi:hypothetical protein
VVVGRWVAGLLADPGDTPRFGPNTSGPERALL